MSSSNRNKQTCDHAMEFDDLLNDLRNWERSMNEKDKKLKAESGDTKKKLVDHGDVRELLADA